jgi:hypothetical protein
MIKVLKTICGLSIVGIVMMLIMSAVPVQRGGGLGRGLGQGPVIKRLGTYKGDTFAGFAEFRVQEFEFDDLGVVSLTGQEPYDMLLNVTYITGAYRFEDAKKTDYSTMVFTSYMQDPILVRQPYNDVVKSIEKAMDEYSK